MTSTLDASACEATLRNASCAVRKTSDSCWTERPMDREAELWLDAQVGGRAVRARARTSSTHDVTACGKTVVSCPHSHWIRRRRGGVVRVHARQHLCAS